MTDLEIRAAFYGRMSATASQMRGRPRISALPNTRVVRTAIRPNTKSPAHFKRIKLAKFSDWEATMIASGDLPGLIQTKFDAASAMCSTLGPCMEVTNNASDCALALARSLEEAGTNPADVGKVLVELLEYLAHAIDDILNEVDPYFPDQSELGPFFGPQS